MKKSDFLAKQFQLAFPNTKKNKEKSMFCRMKNDLISGIDEEEGERVPFVHSCQLFVRFLKAFWLRNF